MKNRQKLVDSFDNDMIRISKDLNSLQDYMNYMKSLMLGYKYPKSDYGYQKVTDEKANELNSESGTICALLENNFDCDAVSPDDDKPFYSKKDRQIIDKFINNFTKFKSHKRVISTFGKSTMKHLKNRK